MGTGAYNSLKEAKRVLSPGGLILFDVPHSDSQDLRYAQMNIDYGKLFSGKLFGDDPTDVGVITYTEKGIRELLAGIGLVEKSVEVFTNDQFNNMGVPPNKRVAKGPYSDLKSTMLIRALRV